MTIAVRAATTADAAAIGRLVGEFQRYLRGLGDRTEFSFGAEEFLRDGFGPRAAFSGVVAEVDSTIAGYGLFHLGYDTDRGRRIVHLIDLFVSESSRRRGVGRALVDRIAHIGRELDARAMLWSVFRSNAVAAAFYERLGARFLTDLRWMAIDL